MSASSALARSSRRSRRRLAKCPHMRRRTTRQNQYAIDAYLKVGLNDLHPDVTLMWLNDPDGTAHASGIGTELTRKSLALVDAGIGRIEDTLSMKGLLDQYQHHRHIRSRLLDAHRGIQARGVPEAVWQKGRRMDQDIVIAEGAIYLRSGHDPRASGGDCRGVAEPQRSGRDFHSPCHRRRLGWRDRRNTVVRRRSMESPALGRRAGVGQLDQRRERDWVRRDDGAEWRRRTRSVESLRHPQHADRRRARLQARCIERGSHRQRGRGANAAALAWDSGAADDDWPGHSRGTTGGPAANRCCRHSSCRDRHRRGMAATN